jgi:VWFA-related protein
MSRGRRSSSRTIARDGVCAFLMALAAGAQTTTIRIPVRVVVVPTLVFSSTGHYIDGLQAGDFRLFDAGRPQQFKLETEDVPVAAVVAVQSNSDLREYIPFISKVGNLLDDSIGGKKGRMAVLAYSDEVSVLKPFEGGTVTSSMKNLHTEGAGARMLDAASEAIKMLKGVTTPASRVLLVIGQPMDHGSKTHLADLVNTAERENVSVYDLKLPEAGKAFIADSLSFAEKDKSGVQVGIELTKGIPVLRRSEQAKLGKDPFTILSRATGGVEIPFRKQKQLEDALIAVGASLRSRYVLSYSPDSRQSGFHRISVQVDKPDAIVYTRPGYTVETN